MRTSSSSAFLLIGALLSLAGCTTPSASVACEGTFNATLAHIIDGDTLEMEECEPRIRLALVDTPELDEPGYAEAANFTAGLCAVGLRATVDQDAGQPIDATGTRIVAVVLCSGKNLNAELLKAGHAEILVAFCGVSEFADDPWARSYCR